MVFNFFRPAAALRAASNAGLINVGSGNANASPSTQSEFYFFNLLICSVAAQSNLIRNGGTIDPSTINADFSAAQSYMANIWPLTGDFY